MRPEVMAPRGGSQSVYSIGAPTDGPVAAEQSVDGSDGEDRSAPSAPSGPAAAAWNVWQEAARGALMLSGP